MRLYWMRFTLARASRASPASLSRSSSLSLIPSKRTYSKVICRPWRIGNDAQASRRSAIFQRRFTGISRSRTSSVVAFNEIASFTWLSSPRRLMLGTIPAVETVMCRWENSGPSGERRRRSDAITLS